MGCRPKAHEARSLLDWLRSSSHAMRCGIVHWEQYLSTCCASRGSLRPAGFTHPGPRKSATVADQHDWKPDTRIVKEHTAFTVAANAAATWAWTITGSGRSFRFAGGFRFFGFRLGGEA